MLVYERLETAGPRYQIELHSIMKGLISIALLGLLPVVHCQLNTLAVAAGKRYFGTATDNPELSDSPYVAQLGNTADFNQITAVSLPTPKISSYRSDSWCREIV
jgi:hypothetical protein